MISIKKLCISDGVINNFDLEESKATLSFTDYEGAEFIITLNDCVSLVEKGSVGFSLSKGKVTKEDEYQVWTLWDDDGVVFSAKFRSEDVQAI